MPAYVIAQVTVTDPEKYADYKKLAAPAVAKYGGKYLVRGGHIEVLEGDWTPPRVVILEFPSVDAAREFYHSTEYAEAKEARRHSAEFIMTVSEGYTAP